MYLALTAPASVLKNSVFYVQMYFAFIILLFERICCKWKLLIAHVLYSKHRMYFKTYIDRHSIIINKQKKIRNEDISIERTFHTTTISVGRIFQ